MPAAMAQDGSPALNGSTIRVVVAKVGLDGHDRGAKVVARGLRDAGMEVIYTGLRRRPDELAEIALQEDADVMGLSILSGAMVPLAVSVQQALVERGLDDVLVVVGGIASAEIRRRLAAVGIQGCFGPGTPIDEAVAFIQAEVAERRRHRGES